MHATTELAKVNVNARKVYVLGNQQPSTICKPYGLGMVKVQRAGGDERIIRPRAPGAKAMMCSGLARNRKKHGINSHAVTKSVITNISPMDRPFTANIARISAKARTHEWMKDSLAAATSNKAIEGDDATFTTAVTVTRLANTCQILSKKFAIADTLEAVDKAGRRSEVKYQLLKAGQELLRDLEFTAVREQNATAGGSATARQMAGAEAWIPSTDNGGNGHRMSSGSTAAYSSPGGGVVTDGTNVALTSTALLTALQNAWEDGGEIDTIMTHAFNRRAIKGFGNLAQNQITLNKSGEAAKLVDSVEVLISDYGKHKLVLNRFMRPETVLCLQMDKWAIAELRPMKTEVLAKTGDAEKRMIVWEGTLVCRDPNANAKVSDTTTA